METKSAIVLKITYPKKFMFPLTQEEIKAQEQNRSDYQKFWDDMTNDIRPPGWVETLANEYGDLADEC